MNFTVLFYSILSQPTRITSNSATLIENIFTNDPNNIVLLVVCCLLTFLTIFPFSQYYLLIVKIKATRRCGSVYLGVVVLRICEVCYVYEGYVGSAVVLYI